MDIVRNTRKVPLFSADLSTLLATGPIDLGVEDHASQKVDESVSPLAEVRQPTSGETKCSACGVAFTDRDEQVDHYRLDWHRLNLKRRLELRPPLSQEEFEKELGELSSISGSDSESELTSPFQGFVGEAEPDQNTTIKHGSPLIHFKTADGVGYAVFKCVLIHAKEEPSAESIIHTLSLLHKPQLWVILMRSGGHFAGAVFRGYEILAHKTFHRYTVRAKQGSAQSARDSHGGGHQPKSAGASLRRYNETALEQEISDLVRSWTQFINEASAIFVRAPKHMSKAFTCGKNCPISATDKRLRQVPFMTRRPTFKEVKRVHSQLAAVYSGMIEKKPTPAKLAVQEETSTMVECARNAVPFATANAREELGVSVPSSCTSDEADKSAQGQKENNKLAKKHRRRRKKGTKQEDDSVDQSVERVVKLCQDGSVGEVRTALEELGIHSSQDLSATCPPSVPQGENSVPPPFNINSQVQGSTLLHTAASAGQSAVVAFLLQAGADPTMKDSTGKTPYQVSANKAARDSFRRYMALNPKAHCYSMAKIPSPLTEEMAAAKKEKLAEKKKAKKKAMKERKMEQQEEKLVNQAISLQQDKTQSLTDRERRAMAAERRMTAQVPGSVEVTRYGVCSWCGASLCGVVAFERLDYKYCRIECVRQHREELKSKTVCK